MDHPAARQPATVLITDHAWPDLAIEQAVLQAAGLRMVAGPAVPASPEAIAALCTEHHPTSVLTCWAVVNEQAVLASPALRHVGRIGVGLDNIDLAACRQRGVCVTNVPDYCVEEVSDHALGFALAWTRGLVGFDRAVRGGAWQPASARLRRLRDLTIGIVGHGRIGRASVRKFGGHGCRVLVHTRQAPAATLDGVQFLPLDDLLTASDVVVLHVPLSAQTRHLIDAKRLACMKPDALLVNVSRGGLVDTDALTHALATGALGAAALDVLESEPAVPDALRALPNVMITPHVAFSSDASLAELRQRAAEEAVRIIRGEAPHHPCL